MDNLKAASYLCEDTQVNDYIAARKARLEQEIADDFDGEFNVSNAEREVLECYNEQTGAVEFVNPNPDHFNEMLKIVKKAGIKKITITSESEIKVYPLYLVYMEWDGKITNITNEPASSYYTFEIELP